VLLLLILAACTDMVGPGFPSDAWMIPHVPVQYATWWRMTEACSGLHGDFNAVQWYQSGADPIALEGKDYAGYWFGAHDRILISPSHLRDGGTVRHEMLHALLRGGGHPLEFFEVRCGTVAPCGSACGLTESRRGVPADAPQLASDSIEVTMSVSPAGAPRASIDSGWMTITVTARNPRNTPVWVRIPGNRAFGYSFARTQGGYYWSAEHDWAFRAGESRSLAFDCQMAPGTRDTVWAYFGHARSKSLELDVAQ